MYLTGRLYQWVRYFSYKNPFAIGDWVVDIHLTTRFSDPTLDQLHADSQFGNTSPGKLFPLYTDVPDLGNVSC